MILSLHPCSNCLPQLSDTAVTTKPGQTMGRHHSGHGRQHTAQMKGGIEHVVSPMELPNDLPSIMFTGERRNDLFQVIVCGKAVNLTHSELKAMIDLVLARANSRTGFIHTSKVTIHRLRRALDEAVASGAGKALIETGCDEEYRVSILPAQIALFVTVTPCFFELEHLHVLSNDDAKQIRGSFRMVQLP